jgi:hypothetical protein
VLGGISMLDRLLLQSACTGEDQGPEDDVFDAHRCGAGRRHIAMYCFMGIS